MFSPCCCKSLAPGITSVILVCVKCSVCVKKLLLLLELTFDQVWLWKYLNIALSLTTNLCLIFEKITKNIFHESGSKTELKIWPGLTYNKRNLIKMCNILKICMSGNKKVLLIMRLNSESMLFSYDRAFI